MLHHQSNTPLFQGLLLSTLLLFSNNCARTTFFYTDVSETEIYLNGKSIGTTPTQYHDIQWLPHRYHLEIVSDNKKIAETYIDNHLPFWALPINALLCNSIPFLNGLSLLLPHQLDDAYSFDTITKKTKKPTP